MTPVTTAGDCCNRDEASLRAVLGVLSGLFWNGPDQTAEGAEDAEDCTSTNTRRLIRVEIAYDQNLS